MSAANTDKKPRIVIYGTGQYGLQVARIAHAKGWPIVAAFNRAGAKVGQDLGTLMGLEEKIGVVVQDAAQANYDGLDADVAVVAVSNLLKDEIKIFRPLLAAGINVISHAAEAYFPAGIDEAITGEIDELAKANNVTFLGAGIWDMSRIWAGMQVAGPCTDIDSFFHRSITDLGRAGLATMRQSGIGLTPDEYAELLKDSKSHPGLYKTIPQHVLHGIGLTVTKISERVEPVIFDEPVHAPSLERDIEAGFVCGTRIIVDVETAEGITAKAHIELRLFREGEIEHMYWKVNGRPSTSIRVERDDSVYASASCMFNRIPDVIAAEPGVKVVSQLGPIRHTVLA